ncbi:MAG: antibiotic biosynthesis monooxygenase [Anaerolineales bacterium]|jgi:heme-degrading monooxygenase HmoA
MMDKKQLYTLGTWKVKLGKEAEFVEAWQAFADWTSLNQPGAGEGILLQNEDRPDLFISFGPWESAENVVHWRAQPEFQDFLSNARDLCIEMQPQNMVQVGRSVPRKSK